MLVVRFGAVAARAAMVVSSVLFLAAVVLDLDLSRLAIGIGVVAEALARVSMIAVDVVVEPIVIAVGAAARDETAVVRVAVAVVPVVVVVRADEVIRDAVAVYVGVGRRQRRYLRALDLPARIEAAPQPRGGR